MSTRSPIDWSVYEDKYNKNLVSEIRQSYESNESAAWDLVSLSNQLGLDRDHVAEFLKELASGNFLVETSFWVCTFCNQKIAEESKDDTCPSHPNEAEHECEHRTAFRLEGVRSADLAWVLTLHGMNTRGPWQERFSWRLAGIYRHSVPVSIYKYGHIVLAPFIPNLQKKYVDQLLNEIRTLQNEAQDLGYRKEPTVIAHSFGSWLLAQILTRSCEDPGEKVVVGRVILTGSIIPPDFDWQKRIAEGQVEAVLCHYSPVDLPVALAHWGIPQSGPSGRIGFNDRKNVVHRKESKFGHSDYFNSENADDIWTNIWEPFLREPITSRAFGKVSNQDGSIQLQWKPRRLRIVTHILKWASLLTIFVIFAVLLACCAYGVYFLGATIKSFL